MTVRLNIGGAALKVRLDLKKAVAYLRRSTDRQEQSIADQKKACLEYAAAHGYEITALYTDDAVSGSITKARNEFLRMVEAAQQSDCLFQYILVYDIYRFGRTDNDEAGYYRHILRQQGVEVIYIKENFNGDDTDDLVRPVIQWQGFQGLVSRSTDTIRGSVSRASKGSWNGGIPPFGFDIEYADTAGRVYMIVRFIPRGGGMWEKEICDPDGNLQRTVPPKNRLPIPKNEPRRLVLGCPERVATAKRALDLALHHDMGWKSISATLNSEGLRAPAGGWWTPSAVRSLITNPVYAGATVYNRKTFAKINCIRGGKPHRLPKRERRRQRYNPEPEWIVTKDTHEALIDWDSFMRIQESIARRREKHSGDSFRSGRSKTSPYLLTGLIKCCRCTRGFQGYTQTKGKKRKDGTKARTRYYACNGYVNGSKEICPRVLFRKEDLEGGVLDLVGRSVDGMLSNGGRKQLKSLLARERKTKTPDGKSEIKRANKELQDLASDKKRLVASLTPKNKEVLDGEFERLAEREKELLARLAKLEGAKHKEVDINATVDEIMASVRGFEDLFPQGTLEEQKEFLRLWIEKIELDPDKRVGKVYIKKFPLPVNGNGNSSFEMVAGARFEPATGERNNAR